MYNTLPSRMQPIAKQLYDEFIGSDKTINDEIINILFSSKEEFKEYSRELLNSEIISIIEEKTKHFQNSVEADRGVWAGIGIESAKVTYSLIRKYKPSVIIETGVCNGVSSLIILSALQQNKVGKLYSIDYPMYANEPLPEFRETAYPEGHAFSAIPSNKEPGWIIPDDLKKRWTLCTGKSQRELPKLITKFDEIDMFIHDSEHTHPCMMFEYEIAWEWLKPGGILLSDDISRNDSFDIFTKIREPKHYGEVITGTGYAIK